MFVYQKKKINAPTKKQFTHVVWIKCDWHIDCVYNVYNTEQYTQNSIYAHKFEHIMRVISEALKKKNLLELNYGWKNGCLTWLDIDVCLSKTTSDWPSEVFFHQFGTTITHSLGNIAMCRMTNNWYDIQYIVIWCSASIPKKKNEVMDFSIHFPAEIVNERQNLQIMSNFMSTHSLKNVL